MADEKTEHNNLGIPDEDLHHGFRENHENPENGQIETRVWYRPDATKEGRWLSALEWDDVNRSPLTSEVLDENGDRRYKLVKGVTATQAEGTDGKEGDWTVTFEATGKSVTIDADTFAQSFAPVKDLGIDK